VKIRISARPLGKSTNLLDELMPGYNREFLLYWVDTIIDTANQLCDDNTNRENKQDREDDYYFLKPVRLATRLHDDSNSPIEIEVADIEAYNCVREAIARHISFMPLTIREFFRNISHPTAAAEA
jgi:hypothetical protein